MTGLPEPWSVHVFAGLVRHLGESVRPLLPTGLEVMTVGLEFALVRRGPDGAARTVRNLVTRPPSHPNEVPSARIAEELLGELQRLIGHHLGRPWPTNSDGVALYAHADQVANEIRPRFVGRGNRADSAQLTLAPFTIPPPPRLP
jgi:hypothetical protein